MSGPFTYPVADSLPMDNDPTRTMSPDESVQDFINSLPIDETEQELVNVRVNDNIVLDIGRDNKIVGIEFLDAKNIIDLKNILPVNFLDQRSREFAEV